MTAKGDGAATPNLSWPKRRGSEYEIRERFGDGATELLRAWLYTGDPLADAVVADMHGPDGPQARRELRQGIAGGLQSLTDPLPAVAALLSSTETVPDYIDFEVHLAASRVHFSVAPVFKQLALSVGALVNTYSSPSIANVLSGTGLLVDAAKRRVEETGKWLLTAMLPGELRPGRAGYEATLQVRMLHAYIRWAQSRRGYDVAEFGVPIGQLDLARTWLDFTYTSYGALERMGIEFRAEEIDTLYQLWWYLGHLLGIDPRLYRNIHTQQEAARLLARLDATNGPVTDQSVALTNAVLTVVAELLSTQTKLPPKAARGIVNGLTHRVHGDAKALALRVPRSPIAAVLPLTAAMVRRDRSGLRQRPDRWGARIDANVASGRDLLATPDTPTAFQATLISQ